MLKWPLLARLRRRLRHSLRHWSRFAPSRALDIAYAASVHQCHDLSSGRAAAVCLLEFCSQPGSYLDRWGSQAWCNRSGCRPLQKADCLACSVQEHSLSCWKIKNSPVLIWRRMDVAIYTILRYIVCMVYMATPTSIRHHIKTQKIAV